MKFKRLVDKFIEPTNNTCICRTNKDRRTKISLIRLLVMGNLSNLALEFLCLIIAYRTFHTLHRPDNT